MKRIYSLSLPLSLCVGILLTTVVTKSSAQAPCAPACLNGYLAKTITIQVPDPCNPANSVTAIICYCYPDPLGPVFPKEQMIIQTITLQPASPCPPDPILMREWKRLALLKHLDDTDACVGVPDCGEWCQENPQCFCPSAFATWELSSGTCMKPDFNVPGEVTYNKCSSGVCGSVFEVCCEDEEPTARWLATQADGSCQSGSEGCILVCQTATDPNIGCHLADGTPVNCCEDGSCPDPNTGKCPE